MKHKLIFIFLLLISNFSVTLAEEIKISAMLHLSGVYAEVGQALREGLELATDEINQTGGVKGKKLKLIYDDTRYDPKTINTLAKKSIEIDKADLALLTNFTEVMIAGPVFEKAKTPLLVLWDSSPEIEALGEYTFGVGIWAPSSAEVTAEYVKSQKLNSYITVSTNNQWSKAVTDKFKSLVADSDIKQLADFTVNPNDPDFRTIVTRIAQKNPDVVFAPITDSQVAFWKQLKNTGYAGIRMTSDVLDEVKIKELGRIAEGIFQTQPADPETPETKVMLSKYQKKYQKECKQIALVAIGYDAMYIVKEALNLAKDSSKESLKDAFYQVKDLKGTTGVNTISPEGSAKKPVGLFLVKDGKFQLVEE